MTEEMHPVAECSRAEARRTQILDAAENCVREYGFHRASISKISTASGMGAGHIYHYFQTSRNPRRTWSNFGQ
jgi:TetR/AcrR family transcriptional repressor of uid operon